MSLLSQLQLVRCQSFTFIHKNRLHSEPVSLLLFSVACAALASFFRFGGFDWLLNLGYDCRVAVIRVAAKVVAVAAAGLAAALGGNISRSR